MKKIPTAEEFFDSKGIDIDRLYSVERGLPYEPNALDINHVNITNTVIEFTQLHVQAVARAFVSAQYDRATSSEVDELTRLDLKNLYPLTNIK
jgi:hypothetical protein